MPIYIFSLIGKLRAIIPKLINFLQPITIYADLLDNPPSFLPLLPITLNS